MIYLRLAWSYLKIGIFGFGGGYAMLSLIEREIVGNGWLTPAGFTDIVAISQMTPGPIGINSATYIGYVIGGILGALMCTFVVVAPSVSLVIASSRYIAKHRQSNFIAGMIEGMRPVVPGLIAAAALLLVNGENFGTETYDIIASVALCIAAFLIVRLTKIHPIWVIVAAGAAGYIIF